MPTVAEILNTISDPKLLIGRQVYVKPGCIDWGNKASRETHIVYVADRYYNSSFKYFVFKSKEYGGYNPVDFPGVYPEDMRHLREIWGVYPENLELLEEIKPTKPVKPYPNTCKHCNSPCRKVNNAIFCSNYKCKTRKVIIKLFKPTISLENGNELNPIKIICPKCSGMTVSVPRAAFNCDVLCSKCSWVQYPFDINKHYMDIFGKIYFIKSKNGVIVKFK